MKTTKLLILVLATIFIASCSETETPSYEGNSVVLTTEQSLIDGDTSQSAKINVELSNDATEDLSLTFAFKDENMSKYFVIEKQPIIIKKGERKGSFIVKSNGQKMIKAPETTAYVKFKLSTVKPMIDGGISINEEHSQSLQITILPYKPIQSAKWKKYLSDYKAKTGIDIASFIGIVSGTFKAKATQDENSNIAPPFDKKWERSYEIFTVIELDTVHSTPNVPILKMTSNALGMNNFLPAYLSAMLTSEFTMPYDKAVSEYLKFSKEKETINVMLDSIQVQSDRNLKFISNKTNPYYNADPFIETPDVVNFKYDYSLQNRWNAVKSDVMIKVGDDNVQKASDLKLEMAITFNPGRFLFETSLNKKSVDDAGGDYVKTYIAPSAKISQDGKTMTFIFSIDHSSQGKFANYTITYKANEMSKNNSSK